MIIIFIYSFVEQKYTPLFVTSTNCVVSDNRGFSILCCILLQELSKKNVPVQERCRYDRRIRSKFENIVTSIFLSKIGL